MRYSSADKQAAVTYAQSFARKKFPDFYGEVWPIVNDILGIKF